jgi:hypothetical protein
MTQASFGDSFSQTGTEKKQESITKWMNIKKESGLIQNTLKSDVQSDLKHPETPHYLREIPIPQPLVYYPQQLEPFRDTTNDFDTRYLQFGLGKPLPDSQSDEFQSISLQSQAPMVLSDEKKKSFPL